MRKLYVLLIALFVGFVSNAQVSVTATAGTTGPTSYTTVNAAFTAINAGTHQGAITILVTANTTEPATPVPLLKSASPSNYSSIVLKPQGNVTINSAASPSTNRGIIELAGADNVTIDGDDPGTVGAQNLTIQSVTSTTSGIACIRLSSNSTTGTDGADNITVKNCILIGARSSATSTTSSYGIQFSNGVSTSSSTTGAYSSLNTVIQNNRITRCYYGIHTIGNSTTYLNTGLQILNNTIGSATDVDYVAFKGIDVSYTATSAGTGSVLIKGNDVRTGFSAGTASMYSIEISTANAGANVLGNYVHDCINPTSSVWGMYAIGISSATSNSDINIANNFIRDITGYATTTFGSQYGGIGIYIGSAATGININYNTIAQLASTTRTCILVNSSTATINQLQNNILINTISNSIACGIYTSGTVNISSGTIDYNDYYVPNGKVGYYNSANQTTLTDWQTATSKDAHSISVDPGFISSTNLHIGPTNSAVDGKGIPVAAITVDFDGDTRDASTPDIGADEYTPLPPGVDVGATAIVNPLTTGCYSSSETVIATVKNYSTLVHDFSVNPVTVTVNVTGAGTYTSSIVINSGTLAPGATQNVTLPATLNMAAAGVYTFNASATATGDVNTGNDAMATAATRTAIAPLATPYTQDFNASTSAPAGWDITGWSISSSHGRTGNGLYKNLYSTVTTGTFILPKLGPVQSTDELKFDLRVLNYNSTYPGTQVPPTGDWGNFKVQISTDCGVNYTDLGIINNTTQTVTDQSFVTYTYPLSAYAGQNVIIRVVGTWVAGDWYGDFDNFNIAPLATIDLSAVTITGLPSGSCAANNVPLSVTVKNELATTHDFSVNPATITLNITGASTQTLTATVNSGSLAAGATQSVLLSPNANFTAGGTHSLSATVSVAGDGNTTNNSAAASKAFIAVSTIPWNEGFSTTSTPTGWSISGWTIGSTRGATGNPGNNIYKNLYSSATTGTFTAIPVGLVSSTDLLTFDYKLSNYSSPYDPPSNWGSFKVQVSTDCGTTFTDLATINDPAVAGWVPKSYPLSAYTGQNVTVRIVATWTSGDYDLAFDNFKIETPAACPAPTSVSAGSISMTAANITWTGTGSFILEYGVSGFTPGSGTSAGVGGTVINPATSPQALSGLTGGTSYDVYVRQDCSGSGNGYSTNSIKYTFSTSPVNDDATGAIALTVNAGCTGAIYTNVSATKSTNEIYPSCSGTGQTPVWFKFTATSTAVRISTDVSTGNTMTDSKLGLFSTSNPADYTTFTILACDDDGGNVGSGYMSVLYATGLNIGTTYYIAVDKYSSSTTNGSFCVAVDDLNSSMLSTTNTCASSFQTPVANSATNYTGWVSLLDASSKLIAMVKNTTGVAIDTYSPGQNVSSVQRQNAGIYYLNRNFKINNSTATNVDVQFFFLDTELASLNTADGTTLGTLGVTRQTGTTCQNDFATVNGSSSFLTQTSNGSQGGVSWIQVNTPGFSNFYLNKTGAILPANLLTFSGSRQGSVNNLKWTVAQEVDVQAYEVERSDDGRTWSKVGTVNSLGNTTAQRSYNFTDNNISGVKQYYRLHILDRNGAAKQSNVVVITGIRPTTLVLTGLFPNPTSSKVNLLVDAPAKDNITIVVMDAVGRVVKSQQASVDAGSNTLSMDVTGLSQGSYLVKLTCQSNCESAVTKFVKE